MEYVACSKCQVVMKHGSITGTKRLLSHRCMDQDAEPSPKRMKLDGFLYKKPQPSAKSHIADVAALISAKDLRPISAVEGDDFHLLAQALINVGAEYGRIPSQDIRPTRNTVSRHLEIQYEAAKYGLVTELAIVTHLGVTCDHWFDQLSHTQYLTVTVQYFAAEDIRARVL